LVSLPRNLSVCQILDRWRDEFKSNRRSSREVRGDDIVHEVVEGLKLYFDRAVGNLLLYRFEKQQYLEIKENHADTRMSNIYGAEHLLRLFG
jgi:mortality factor 4-like protein 1